MGREKPTSGGLAEPPPPLSMRSLPLRMELCSLSVGLGMMRPRSSSLQLLLRLFVRGLGTTEQEFFRMALGLMNMIGCCGFTLQTPRSLLLFSDKQVFVCVTLSPLEIVEHLI